MYKRCLGATEMNAAIAAAFTPWKLKPLRILNTSPYKAVGPYFPVTTYFDTGAQNGNQDVGEPDIQGTYNNIGGALINDVVAYTSIVES